MVMSGQTATDHHNNNHNNDDNNNSNSNMYVYIYRERERSIVNMCVYIYIRRERERTTLVQRASKLSKRDRWGQHFSEPGARDCAAYMFLHSAKGGAVETGCSDLYDVLLYNTTPIHCTPLTLHPPVMNTRVPHIFY